MPLPGIFEGLGVQPLMFSEIRRDKKNTGSFLARSVPSSQPLSQDAEPFNSLHQNLFMSVRVKFFGN